MGVVSRQPYSKYVEVYTDQHSCMIALYKGIEPEELSAALEGAFSASNSNIVGFEDVESKIVISLKLVCLQPEILNGTRYKLLFRPSVQVVAPLQNGEAKDQQIDVLLETVDSMRADDLITVEQAELLEDLIESYDERTSATYQVYLIDNNLEELRDTLLRLCHLAEEEAEESVEEPELTNVELISIVSQLENRGFLDEEECIVLGRLSEMEHALVRAACEVYLQDKDEADLADTLKRISRHLSITRTIGLLLNEGRITSEQFNHLHHMFFTGEPRLLQTWSTYCVDRDDDMFVEFLLTLLVSTNKYDFIKQMGEMKEFTPEEEQALTELLRANDASVLAAFDVYFVERNEADACDTLRRIAQIQLKASAESGNGSTAANDKKRKVALFDVLKTLKQEKKISQDTYDALSQMVASGDPNTTEAYEAFKSSGDTAAFIKQVEELAKTVSNAAINEDLAILNLLMQLVEADRLSSDNARTLALLLEIEDASLLAAFDVYEDEKNLDDFVDTLLRIVRLYNNSIADEEVSDTDSLGSTATYDEHDSLDDDTDEAVSLEDTVDGIINLETQR